MGPFPTGIVAVMVVPSITLTLPGLTQPGSQLDKFEFATYTYPFPLSYATPSGAVPTGIVAMTVPPPESGVGAEVATPSGDWSSSPLTSRGNPKGPGPTTAAMLPTATSRAAASAARRLIARASTSDRER